MPVVNVTESIVAAGDNLVVKASGESAWVRDLWPGLATVVAVSGLLVLVLMAAVIYKVVTACSKQNFEEPSAECAEDEKNLNASGNIYVKRPSVCEAPIHKWMTEDNPHNKWQTADYGRITTHNIRVNVVYNI
jgi:hypothetical protein